MSATRSAVSAQRVHLAGDFYIHGPFEWMQFVKNVFHVQVANIRKYEGWNFNSGNYLFTTDTK